MYPKLFLVIVTVSNVAFSHFILQYPPSLGFDDGIEGTAPCGGFPVVFNSSDVDTPVNGFSASMLSTHPQAQWLFRGTLSKQAPFNWTNLLPVVMETGLGQFCPTGLSAPPEFAGQSGLIQVQQDAADGLLYQCAAVNFVSGANMTVGSACTNATGLTAIISTENNFANASSAGASATSSMASTASATSASASAASASSSSTSAAISYLHGNTPGPLVPCLSMLAVLAALT